MNNDTACVCEHYTDFKCMDCAACTNCNGEYYMLRDPIWYSAITAMDRDGMLCIGCVEQRLDRNLTRDDFSLCPLNVMNEFEFETLNRGSARLYDRLNTYLDLATKRSR